MFAFMLLGIWLILYDGPRSTLGKDIFAFIVIVIPSFIFVVLGLSILLKIKPAIEFLESGLKWNVSVISKGYVEWGNIKSVATVNYRGNWFVNLELEDLNQFISEHPFFRRQIYHFMINRQWPISPASIPGTGIKGTSAGKLTAEIKKRIKHLTKTLTPTGAQNAPPG